MQADRSQWMAQRAIVQQVLDDDRAWPRAELERALSELDPPAVDHALARLEAEGVVVLERDQVRASSCTRHLDALELIGI
jgi:DNA-binding transcriptional ArsR family regulator